MTFSGPVDSRDTWSPLYGGLCPSGCTLFEHVHRVGKDVGAGEQGVAQLRMMRTREDATAHCGASSISHLVVYLRRWKSGLLTMRTTNPSLRPRLPGRGNRPAQSKMSPQDVPIDCVQQAEERLLALFAKEALRGARPEYVQTSLHPCPNCRETYSRRRAKLIEEGIE